VWSKNTNTQYFDLFIHKMVYMYNCQYSMNHINEQKTSSYTNIMVNFQAV